MIRTGTVQRTTQETDIKVELTLMERKQAPSPQALAFLTTC